MPKPKRPMPDDFAEMRVKLGHTDLCKHYCAGSVAVTRWIKECEVERPRPVQKAFRPRPADFAEMNAKLGLRPLAEHYRTGVRVVVRWREEIDAEGVQTVRKAATRPIPADFADQAKRLHARALCRHYKTSREVLGRWLAETGIVPPRFNPTPPPPPRWQGVSQGVKNSYGNVTVTRSITIYEDAAKDIQKFAPVYRCNPNGVPNPEGTRWRIGSAMTTLSGDELIERAERYRRRAA